MGEPYFAHENECANFLQLLKFSNLPIARHNPHPNGLLTSGTGETNGGVMPHGIHKLLTMGGGHNSTKQYLKYFNEDQMTMSKTYTGPS
jgi:hypothetical protein